MDIYEKLKQLDELYTQADALRLSYDDKRSEIIPPDVMAELIELDAEYHGQEQAINDKKAELEGEVKAMVATLGTSVKSDRLQAVYNKGRVSWDTKALDGYAVAHPEIATFRKVGEPSVSIRKV